METITWTYTVEHNGREKVIYVICDPSVFHYTLDNDELNEVRLLATNQEKDNILLFFLEHPEYDSYELYIQDSHYILKAMLDALHDESK